jgi:hypothetical protein
LPDVVAFRWAQETGKETTDAACDTGCQEA